MTHRTIADVSQAYQAPGHSRGAAPTSSGRAIGARWARFSPRRHPPYEVGQNGMSSNDNGGPEMDRRLIERI